MCTHNRTHKAILPMLPWNDKGKTILAVKKLCYVLQFLRTVYEVVVINQYSIFERISHIAIIFIPISFAKIVIFLLLTKFLPIHVVWKVGKNIFYLKFSNQQIIKKANQQVFAEFLSEESFESPVSKRIYVFSHSDEF